MCYVELAKGGVNLRRSNFSDRLALLLCNLHYTQKDFCVLTGITEAAISRYIKGERTPNADTLVVIKDMTNVNIDWLLGYGPDEPMILS